MEVCVLFALSLIALFYLFVLISYWICSVVMMSEISTEFNTSAVDFSL